MSSPESMSKHVKWFFGLPLAYILYFVISLILPQANTSANAVIISQALRSILLTACVLLIVKFFLKIEIKNFVHDSSCWNHSSFFKGFYLMLIALTVTALCEYFIFPNSIVKNTLTSKFLGNWICSLILVVVSAFSEELIFRCYISWFGLNNKKNNVLAYSFASAVLFTIAHFTNPEVEQSAIWSMLFYFIFGFCLMVCFIRTRGIEFGLGMHIANNLFAAWFINYNNSVLPTQSLFISQLPISYLTILQAVLCLEFCTALCPDREKE